MKLVNLGASFLFASYLILLVPIAVFGLVAYADFNDRGCFTSEAAQCSDARSTMILAVSYAVVGPILWLLVRALRTGPAKDTAQ